jgi:hypothetical protein
LIFLLQAITFDDQQIQTDFIFHIDVSTQYDLDTAILPIVFSEELPISNEISVDQESQTTLIDFNDCASQSTIITYANRYIQTELYSNLYSSSLYIVPTSTNQSCCSSTILIMPKENQSSPIFIDQEIQCDLYSSETTIIPIEIECKINNNDRRSIIQQQMDEKEKQMNRIIGKISLKN